tara:strand:+ start:241 stop:1599 length:1359 start_codon:yes stop_codon:yes gene_type:complete
MFNKSLLKTLGPGILFASTCIGVSHLVQSTRAGAVYGFDLVWAIILANLFKYPFFEFASRYANATGTSIIDGYKKLGKGILWLYLVITVATMFFVCAVVTVVTGGFMDNLFAITPKMANLGVSYPYLVAPILILVVCVGILFAGKYKLLDSMIKIIGAVLLVSTVLAFVLALLNGSKGDIEYRIFNLDEALPVAFLIPLMGWMPTALDLSSWNSLWTVARIKQTGYHPKLKETLFDFNFGYLASAILALFFVTLGAYLMYGTGKTLPSSSGLFAASVVDMYTSALGGWSKWIIAPAAFSIMFGTAIAVFDGYSRSVARIITLLVISDKTNSAEYEESISENKSLRTVEKTIETKKIQYNLTLVLLAGVAFGILLYTDVLNPNTKSKGFKSLVDFTTALSFVVAPVIAVLNFILVRRKYVGERFEPPIWKKILSYAGIVFLAAFSVFYFVTIF